MGLENIAGKIGTGLQNKAKKIILDPLNQIVDENVTDVVTTIGNFVARSIRGKFQRSITFTIGTKYADKWMEEALYGILYQWNDIKGSSQLEITNKVGMNDGTGMYYRLDNGTHSMKYRNWDILVCIQTANTGGMTSPARFNPPTIYTIITYDMSPEFCKTFERDMLAHRNSLLRIKADKPTISVFQDLHEADGYTYWEKALDVSKRRIGTVYMPREKMKTIVDTVNEFFSNREYYHEHGVAHNLKILLYGPPGPQPIETMIPVYGHGTKIVYEKCMGDIVPGDKVFNRFGEPIEVSEIYEYKNLEVWEVEFEDGRKTRCASTHMFPIMSSNGNGFVPMSVDQMVHSLLDENGNYRYRIPYTTGPASGYKWNVCNSMERRTESQIKEDAAKLATMGIVGEDDYAALYAKYKTYLAETIENRQLFFNEAFQLMRVSMEMVEHTVDRGYYLVKVTTDRSKKMIGILKMIAASIGISISKYGDFWYKIGPKMNVVYGMGIDEKAGLAIKSIRNTGELSDMVCLHVDDPEHLYLTNDYLVTCNSGKDTIAKMIATEWNRNIYYVTGGKGGMFIPNAIRDDDDEVNSALILISDIDKYPFLINEPDVQMEGGDAKEEQMKYKQAFGNMINALDGVLAAEDRIIVMTTNHIEKFSETFLRPGRVDLKMEIGYVTPEVFRRYVRDYYGVVLPENIKLKDKALTVATMQRDVMFMKLDADAFIKKYAKLP